jgi:chemosensory pili system protein ChpA (sensor histidine kinase/response regulator)
METVSTSRNPLEILVVDDSVSVRQVFARLLRTKGWKTNTARDGVEALEKLANARPDLIILDLEMPRMNGYEFLSTLQAREEYRDIPVIMVTSRAAEKHRRKALGLGAREYVVKPFDHDKLLGLVERLATEAKPSMAWSDQS